MSASPLAAPTPFTLGDLTGTTVRPLVESRPPILFIHGLLGGSWYFDKYQTFFAERGYPSYAVNLRGHHDSRPVADVGRVSLADYVDDAREVARWITEGYGTRPIVMGHSMGGLVAQKLAELEALAALVLLCAAPPRGILITNPRLAIKQLKYLVPMLRSRPLIGTRADSDDLTLNRVPFAERQALHERFVPDSGRAGREISIGVMAVDARAVRCPVLSVSAAEDRFVPARIGRQLARKYGGDYLLVPGHAHFIVGEPGWEGPAGEIERWLATHA